MGTLIVQYGAYHCGECLQLIAFDWVTLPDGTSSQLRPGGYAVGHCYNSKCDRKGLRMRVKLQTIEVEELHDA
jgi:hypothetical protein